MRVSDTNSSPIQSTETRHTGKAGSSKDGKKPDQAGGPHAGGSESVKSDISTRGKEMARATAAAHSAPDVREDRIAELKKRISEGSYKVDANAVADRLVEDHLAADIG
jgi:negative regulator of flagellin synthesis FlgM